MSAAVVSLAVGLGVGVLYGVIGVRSPAPPLIALLGLLGIVGGEHAVALVREHLGGALATWIRAR